uniref:Uncharacterized protein n=1 Tax=Plectus sambesii TaxID=2011161 RepID=A0A914WDG8_9BILA
MTAIGARAARRRGRRDKVRGVRRDLFWVHALAAPVGSPEHFFGWLDASLSLHHRIRSAGPAEFILYRGTNPAAVDGEDGRARAQSSVVRAQLMRLALDDGDSAAISRAVWSISGCSRGSHCLRRS